MSAGSRRLRKALLLVPAAVVVVLVLAEVMPELAVIAVLPLLLPLAVFSARWDTAALEQMPVVAIDGTAAEPGEVFLYQSLPSSLFAAFLPVGACVFAAWALAVEFEDGWVASLVCLGAAGLVLLRCHSVSVELRWDEVVVRNPIRTYRLPWPDIRHVFQGANGTISFATEESMLAVDALATQLRLKREFVRELRRFAAAHEHVTVDAVLERKLS